MKKIYQKPEMKAIEIKCEQFIATSGPQLVNEDPEGDWSYS